ncbi:MAG: nuclear transport factor 2 family protein [Vicinamibacterales bacterium]
MSQQDVGTMRQAYVGFNNGDIPAVLSAFDAQIAWHEPGGERAPQGTFQGADRVGGEVFSTVPEHFTEFRAEPAQFIDAGDHVVVVGRFQGTSKRGQVMDAPFAHVWEMRNGKAVSFHNHVDHKAWTQGWAE